MRRGTEWFGEKTTTTIAVAENIPDAGALGYTPLLGCRLLNTGATKVPANTVQSVIAWSACGIPAGTPAVLLNVVSVNAAGAGHLLVWGDASSEPSVPALNYAANTVVGNGTVANFRVDAGTGTLKVKPYASATQVIIDVEGYFWDPAAPPPGALSTKFYGTAPCRIFNSMSTEGGGTPQPLVSGGERTFGVLGPCDIPNDAKAVALSIVSVAPTTQGHIVAYPASGPEPTPFSSLNFAAGETRANASVVPVGSADLVLKATLGTGGTTHAIVDVTGYYK
jgi:hypothetical protein